jgi:hypothetical protein
LLENFRFLKIVIAAHMHHLKLNSLMNGQGQTKTLLTSRMFLSKNLKLSMQRSFLFILLATATQNSYSQNKDLEGLIKLNKDWINSYPQKDTATLNKIFAEDFVLISPKGIKMTKSDVINNIKTQEIISVNIDSSDVRLLTDDVGLITAYVTFVFKTGNKEMTGKNCYQDVYIKRKNRWLALAAHVTLPDVK